MTNNIEPHNLITNIIVLCQVCLFISFHVHFVFSLYIIIFNHAVYIIITCAINNNIIINHFILMLI